jgi:hypothetical protein
MEEAVSNPSNDMTGCNTLEIVIEDTGTKVWINAERKTSDGGRTSANCISKTGARRLRHHRHRARSDHSPFMFSMTGRG